MKEMLLFSLGAFLLLGGATLGENENENENGNVVKINNANEFIEFSNSVNSGTDFLGSTVVLESDIKFTDELSKQFKPVGYFNSWSDHTEFQGVFDGQGHIISNLKMNSSSYNVGVFGFSDGLTIKNLVVDGSSSFLSYQPDQEDYSRVNIGSILGRSVTSTYSCIIENIVNMASIIYNRKSPYSIAAVGGVVGYIDSDGGSVLIKNCANYGSITESGESKNSYVGGIAGYLFGNVVNCFNYGTITHDGTIKDKIYVGGIVGYSEYSVIENSVSYGNVLSQNKTFVGGIVGYLDSSSISHCYWSPASNNNFYAMIYNTTVSNMASFDANFVLNESVSVGSFQGTSLVGALNAYSEYYDIYDYSLWVINKNENTVSFNVNGAESSYTLNSKIILLPSLANEGKSWFDGWYVDSDCTIKLGKNEITGSTKLYGKREENAKEYTITFDARGGTSVDPFTAQFGTIVSLPNNTAKENCKIVFWEDKFGNDVEWNITVPARNITLYAFWQCTRIGTAEEFAAIGKIITHGFSYEGMTVYLESDLDFSGMHYDPIGYSSNEFDGVFDGQGHTFSNVIVKTSAWYRVGLFGSLAGATVKNVVIDDSCLFTDEFSVVPGYLYIGSLSGMCYTYDRPCIFENIVNMADVAFIGSIVSKLMLGGIVGEVDLYNSYTSYLRNCVNYGSVTHSGNNRNSYIGGIIGNSYYDSIIQNCLNAGTITLNGVSAGEIDVGGIIGYGSRNVLIENCLSAGTILVSGTSNRIGGITGYVRTSVNITNSFWSSALGLGITGEGTLFVDNETSQADVGAELLGKLNGYAAGHSWNKWILNAAGKSVSFEINYGKGFAVKSQVILLPDPADINERAFSGWYKDDVLTAPFDSSEVSSDTSLYGMLCWPSYTVALDVNGGDKLLTDKYTFECNGAYPSLPNATKAGHFFVGWFTEPAGGIEIEPMSRVKIVKNHTLYAHWDPIICTVTFVLVNGTTLSDEFEYGSTIVYPEVIEREGYTLRWYADKPCSKPFEGTTVTGDITIYAKYVSIQESEGSSHGSFSFRTSPVIVLVFILLFVIL